MRVVWLIFVGLIAAMALVLPRLNRSSASGSASRAAQEKATPVAAGPEPLAPSFAALREAPAPGPLAQGDSVVAFGLAQRGTPYVYAGVSPITGFDCSGFIMYTFAHFGVAVPHSTALLIDVGRPVGRTEAQPGDIVVFTGTATTSTTPGHAGIVITRKGEKPLRFVHASSSRREPFVKVSQVEDSDYERRFMQVRRVLGLQELAAARPAAVKPRPAAPVAALPARPVAVREVPAPAAAPPKKLATKKVTGHTLAKKKAAARKTAAKKTIPKRKAAPVAKRKAPVKGRRTVPKAPAKR